MNITVENRQSTTAVDAGRVYGATQSFKDKMSTATKLAEETGAKIDLTETKETKGTKVVSNAKIEPPVNKPQTDSVNLNRSQGITIGFGAQNAVISLSGGSSSNQGSGKTSGTTLIVSSLFDSKTQRA